MRTIYKYELPGGGICKLKLPQGFKKLHLGLDPCGDLCMWAEVDTEMPLEDWLICGLGTGWSLNDLLINGMEKSEYMGTINDGIYYMWHYYGKKMTEREIEQWNL